MTQGKDVMYKTPDGQNVKLSVEGNYKFQITPEQSEWQCFLFGNRPDGLGIVYRPRKGKVPNLFVRWMMRIFFDCLWVKDKKGEPQ
jgi:hypothetical protein